MGTGEGEIHPLETRRTELSFHGGNYRITDADRLENGNPRQKYAQNVAAIRVLQTLGKVPRAATSDEKATLVKYSGWGGLPQVFATAEEAPKWVEEQNEIRELLTSDELTSARATVLNAHFTAPGVIRAMYAAVERLGFKSGRILEPACGNGHFLGVLPPTLAGSAFTGVEIDPITARIARALYPESDIRCQGFEDATLPTNTFDLVISNVPFGDYSPHDPKLNPRKFKIHDYFFVGAADKARPGGLIAFITSRGTLDKQYPHLRETIAKSCNLITAIRLPNTAFKAMANTEVTTDIVILRKRLPGESPAGSAWLESKPFVAESAIFLNEFYHSHPENMLGKLERAEYGMYGRNEVRLSDDGRDLDAALAAAVARLPKNVYRALTAEESASVKRTIPAPPGVKPNAYVITTEGGGGLAVRDGEELRLLTDLPAMTSKRIRRLISVRDATRECLRLQVEDRPDAEVDASRFRLNQEYDFFVNQFGPISLSANVRAFAGDPDLPLLLSLENFNDETETSTKTAIFRERTIQKRSTVEAAADAKEALVVTLSEKGQVDLDHIAKLLDRKREDFLPELQGALFLNPETDRWETDDDYLSGNVREKLRIAETAAGKDSRYQLNVAALQGVQPIDLRATEIDARLGATWLPCNDIADFTRELLRLSDSDVTVGHAVQVGLWSVEVRRWVKENVSNREEWGTKRITGAELIEHALNLRTPTIYDYDENKTPHLNITATEAAREKQQKIKDKFVEWVWADDTRRERLVRAYNDEFNTLRLRSFNGDHLTLPGVSPTVTLRPHQTAGVWRIIQSPNVLLAHVVGAGKTYTMVAAAMEMKRLGLARKPMFVVPNHMLGQFSTELLALYPNANILAAGRDDFATFQRRELMSRIATNNWDAVIVTHSGFERLSLDPEARRKFMNGQLEELEDCIRDHKEKSGKGSSGTRMVKELERAKKKLEGKLKALGAEHKKDDTLTFEALGVDRLFVDEAQAFKNLFYISKMTRVAGLSQAASERALDMLLKVQHVQKLNGGGGVVFATGTPITNTMAEMFTMQRYLQPHVLRRHGLQHFDAWAGTFGETVTAMELSPDGAGYRLNTRFARFVNVPELMNMFRQMADVQTKDMLKLPVPILQGNKPQIVSAPATKELKAFVATLAKRAEKLRTQRIDPSIDNMLKITGEGRKAALDLRLVHGRKDHPDGKVNVAVREILAVWNETASTRLTQMVFCDLSTPHSAAKGFSVYQDMHAKLVAAGVPPAEIAFIQNYDADAAKLALFKDVRTGKIRILFGSTQKMGAGTNAQTKLFALHHLDAPWRPADIEQREGRILRQGNENQSVRIFRYVTEGSFDAYMWQTLETKAKFIAQVMTGETTARRIEDLDSPALTYAEVKAIASGNPLVIEKAKVDSEVMRLARLQAEHRESEYSNQQRVRSAEDQILRHERNIAAMEKDTTMRQDTQGEKFRITLENKIFTERAEAGNALVYLVNDHKDDHRKGRDGRIILGELAGFKLEFRSTRPEKITIRGSGEYTANVTASPVGCISSLEHAIRCIDDSLVETRREIAYCRKQLAELNSLFGKPFEHEERYRELVKRQSELVDLLDIAKNQAASATPGDPDEETVKSVETADSVPEKRIPPSSKRSKVVRSTNRPAPQPVTPDARIRLSAA